MERIGVRVRGIYATALTRLLLDHKLPIADPTDVIKERFSGEISEEIIPVVTIKDREDKQAVVIIGLHSLAERVLNVIKSEVKHSVVKEASYELYSTYKVRIKGKSGRGYIVELPDGEGELLSFKNLNEGEEVVAHVIRVDRERPLLEQGGAVIGLYTRAFEGKTHTFSHFIKDFEKRAMLLSAASSSGIEGWGIRFRSYAGKADISCILEDLKNVKDEIKKLKDKYEKVKAPYLLKRGEVLAFVILPLDAKRKMDELRRKQIPTIDFHHFYKASRGKISECLDLLERVTCVDDWRSVLEVFLDETLSSIDGKMIEVKHEKIHGSEYSYRCKVTVLKDNILKFERAVKSVGVYNGLGIKREPGDIVESYTAPFSRVIIHKYMSSDGEVKGFYGNVNTPFEISPQGSGWYLDLEVDVTYIPGSGVRIVDKEKLEEAYSKGMIDKTILDTAYECAERIKKMFKDNMEPVNIVKKLLEIPICSLKK